jgi:hypothetical protein
VVVVILAPRTNVLVVDMHRLLENLAHIVITIVGLAKAPVAHGVLLVDANRALDRDPPILLHAPAEDKVVLDIAAARPLEQLQATESADKVVDGLQCFCEPHVVVLLLLCFGSTCVCCGRRRRQ